MFAQCQAICKLLEINAHADYLVLPIHTEQTESTQAGAYLSQTLAWPVTDDAGGHS